MTEAFKPLALKIEEAIFEMGSADGGLVRGRLADRIAEVLALDAMHWDAELAKATKPTDDVSAAILDCYKTHWGEMMINPPVVISASGGWGLHGLFTGKKDSQ